MESLHIYSEVSACWYLNETYLREEFEDVIAILIQGYSDIVVIGREGKG